MKKYIPKGLCCHGNTRNSYCKWLKYIKTIKRDKSNCEYASSCDKICWSTPDTSCYNDVYKCEYLNYTDYTQESLLWDACKECGIKVDY